MWPLVVSALLGFFFAHGIISWLELSARKKMLQDPKTKMKVLEQIISFVNHFYFDQVDFDKIMDGSLGGLMEELDPHSTYILQKNKKILVNYSREFSRYWN